MALLIRLSNNTNKTIIACFHTRIDIAVLPGSEGCWSQRSRWSALFVRAKRITSLKSRWFLTTCCDSDCSCAQFPVASCKDQNLRSVEHKQNKATQQITINRSWAAAFSRQFSVLWVRQIYIMEYTHMAILLCKCEWFFMRSTENNIDIKHLAKPNI